MSKKRVSKGLKTADCFIYFVVLFWVIITVYPFLNVIAVSISSYHAYLENPLRIIPGEITFEAYVNVFMNELLFTTFKNTVIITSVHVLLVLVMCVITAYPLSLSYFRGKGLIMKYILITMLFNGGLIPNFYLIRSIRLYNTLGALFIFGLCPAFYIILTKNFFESIPNSLLDAAAIDGASHLTIVFKIIVPVSKSILATLVVFTSVGKWNSFFDAIVYTRESSKWTLMVLLREILMSSEARRQMYGELEFPSAFMNPIMVKDAAIIIMVFPIIIIYPFLQKYFIKGVMLGAIKE